MGLSARRLPTSQMSGRECDYEKQIVDLIYDSFMAL